jgi:DNA-binding IclR family transcriptional regulator
MASNTLVPAVDKAARALSALAEAGQPQGISELARTLRVPKGTMRSILLTLDQHGFVQRDADQRFRIGPQLRALADAGVPDLTTMAAPALRALVAEFGETAILGIPAPPRLLLAAALEPDSPFHVSAHAGGRIPLDAGCHGKVLLKHQPIGYDDETYVPGVRAVAAPILDARSRRVGCLMVVGFKQRLDLRLLRRVGARTAALALELSAKLGRREAPAARPRIASQRPRPKRGGRAPRNEERAPQGERAGVGPHAQ